VDQALGWIGAIAEWLGKFFPRWIVLEPTQAAVKVTAWEWRRLINRGDVKPTISAKECGIVFWWPAVTVLTVYPVARQANNLQAQTIVTKDNKTFAVAGMIVFHIHDPLTLITTVFDPDDTIRDIALSAIHDACIQHDSESLLETARSGKLDREMRSESYKQLKRYGVTVEKVTLTDLSPCRVYRLVNSEPTERP